MSGQEQLEQRKQVTVLFCDLVDYAAMAEKMDPEDVREVLNLFFQPWRKAIAQHRGTLEKFIGDAVMAVFGIPLASESDPENAIRAALQVRDQLDDLNHRVERQFGVRLAMRVGINTGPVLVGAVGRAGDSTVTGHTVNLASRLESLSPTNSILISHDTYRHVRGIFDVEPLEPVVVRGIKKPIQVYVAQRAKSDDEIYPWDTRGVEGVETRMIGREAELECLQDAFGAAAKGRGQTIILSAEAGIGKTRLLYEFEIWLELLRERVRYFKGRSSLETQHTPYALLRDLFAFRFKIRDSDRASIARAKVEAGIQEVLGGDERGQIRAHVIGQLLGFDFSASPHLQGVLEDAKQLHDRALIYLDEFFQAAASLNPTVIFLEDIHWADDSSLDVFNHIARTAADQRLLIVGLARPLLFEREGGWFEKHTRLELRPLSQQDSHQLVNEILQKVKQVPDVLRKLVASRSEGNPFYVEELIKMFIEEGIILTGDEHWRVEPVHLTDERVPSTLTEVLQARLDGLPAEERAVLQGASVVGRAFWNDTVEYLSTETQRRDTPAGYAIRNADENLAALHERELIFRRKTSTFAGTREYIFKHALLRDVTYEGVLKRVRRLYHGLVAEWLIEHSGERAGEHIGLIADHLDLAGEKARAAIYLRRAGELAAAKFANNEAASYFGRALDLTPETNAAERYTLLLAREQVHSVTASRDEQHQDLIALQALAEALDDDHRRSEVALRRASYAESVGDYETTSSAAKAAIDYVQAIRNLDGDDLSQKARRIQAESHRLWGLVLSRQGDFDGAKHQMEQSLNSIRAWNGLPGSFSLLAQGAIDPLAQTEANSLLNLGSIFSAQGEIAQARDLFEQARRIFDEIGDQRGVVGSLHNLGSLYLNQGNHGEAARCYQKARDVYEKIGDLRGEGMATGGLGIIASEQGDYSRARDYYQQAIAIFQRIGDRRSEGIGYDNLGAVFANLGDEGMARDYYAQALEIYREIGDRQGTSRTLGNLGASYMDQGEFDKARAYYEQALDIKREIGDRRGEGIVLSNLGLLFHYLNHRQSSRECCEQSVLIARELGDRNTLGYALTHLGHALSSLTLTREAANAYEEALSIRRELGQTHLVVDSLAGLAQVSLIQGDLNRAQVQIDEISHHLKMDPSLEGSEEPFWVYLTCYRVLRANQDPRANEILNTAYNLLQERANKISDEDLRCSFLENIAAHREIVSEWQR